MKKHLSLIAATTLSLVIFSGCASYRASSLSMLPVETVFKYTNPNTPELLVVAKAFNNRDCERYLDRDILSEGYQPIQICLRNNSNKQYVFTLDRISTAIASVEEVAEKVHTSTVGRAAGYGAGALLLWPLAIPAVIDGVKSYQANKALDQDFASKAAKNKIIPAHSQMNSVLFIPLHSFEDKFTITLIDNETKEPITLTVVVTR